MLVAAVSIAFIASCSLPSRANAAWQLTVAPGWKSSTAACTMLGQSDERGVRYVTCGNRIARFDKDGVRLADIPLPAGIVQPRDVAPSPDGRYLYITQGTNPPRRLNRVTDTRYDLDAAWRLARIDYWGALHTPIGWALHADGRGDLYMSNGSYWVDNGGAPTPDVIAKFAPDGRFLTSFGDYGRNPGQWITNQDLVVSRDGRRVYVGENCGVACRWDDPAYQGSRVTRYDYAPGGGYRFTRVVTAQGPRDGFPFPPCESAGATHSAYSVALDGYDNLYVTSTTCGRLQKFDAQDRFVQTVASYVDPAAPNGTQGRRNHYISSDWAGRIFAAEWNLQLAPDNAVPPAAMPGIQPLPEPDTVAPVVGSTALPDRTTTRQVTVTVEATDNQAVAEMRLANEDGIWSAWGPYQGNIGWTLTAGYSVKGVYVQVRDMAGNLSNTVYRTLRYEQAAAGVPEGGDGVPPPAGPDVTAPLVAKVTIPPLTAEHQVTVGVEATDDVGVRDMRLANEDGTWAPWEPFRAARPWTLSAGYSAKAVYVQVRDAAGNESRAVTVRTQVTRDAPLDPPPPGAEPDRSAPDLAGLTLPVQTTTQTVVAAVDASDDVAVAQVRFANEDGVWAAWQPWAARRDWTLTAGYANKVVFAQVRDAAGNESNVQRAATRFIAAVAAGPLDQAAPALLAVTLPNPARQQAVTLTIDATDDVGVVQMRLANEDGTWLAWRPFTAATEHTLSPGNTPKAVYVQVRDAAGRESNVLFTRTVLQP